MQGRGCKQVDISLWDDASENVLCFKYITCMLQYHKEGLRDRF